MKRVTAKKIDKYIKHGSCCPACSSDSINGGSLEVDGTIVMQNLDCVDCGLMWTDIYRLETIDNVEYREEK